MDDLRIIELYFERDEQAIKETDAKYGKLCHSIAYNILNNHEDSEESKVKNMLFYTRNKLRDYLIKEGVEI